MINKKMAAALAGLGMAIGLSFTVNAEVPDCTHCDVERFSCIRSGADANDCYRQYRYCLDEAGCIVHV